MGDYIDGALDTEITFDGDAFSGAFSGLMEHVKRARKNYRENFELHRVRLSTLIRYGADHSKYVQGEQLSSSVDPPMWIDDLSSPPAIVPSESRPKTLKTCAWGAARLGATMLEQPDRDVTERSDLSQRTRKIGLVTISEAHLPDVLIDYIKEEVSSEYRIELPIRRAVMFLNDRAEWSRGEIADWVDDLIDEHGYGHRLHVTIRVDKGREFDLSPYTRDASDDETREIARDCDEKNHSGDSIPQEEIAVEPNLATAHA